MSIWHSDTIVCATCNSTGDDTWNNVTTLKNSLILVSILTQTGWEMGSGIIIIIITAIIVVIFVIIIYIFIILIESINIY